MRELFIVLILFTCSISCSTIEDNSPALQGLNDNVLFKSARSQAIMNPDGTLVISGENGIGEAVQFFIRDEITSQIVLGGSTSNQNRATFIDNSGNQFSTAFEDATGTVNYNLNFSESISGNFKFTAFTADKNDTVVFSRGFIYQVPFIDAPEPNLEDQFSARINTIFFTPSSIVASVLGEKLTLSGERPTQSITLVLPVDSASGNYEMMGGTSVFGSLINDNGVSISTSGTLQVISNDLIENRMTGTFIFDTAEGFSVTKGMFTINY